MRQTLAGAVLALALASCGGVSGRVTTLYGGADHLATVRAPDSVAAYRVIEPGQRTYVRAPDTIATWEQDSGPVPVDDETARELAEILSDDGTYDWPRAKGCVFKPGVALRFTRGTDVVDVLLCFLCDELAIYQGTARLGIEDFDAARPRLVRIVKRLFPQDQDLQALR